ncbi:CBS domain-containing protein [Yinghuangia seranimata]|uniref:CBS domain-containing protein n=1 Tax=Yinghuangia seranimata TaxID=408067 RepID=UPI00248AFE4B|nr:CBS domain-containing protein [Yinghuangia seranimata]MDI2125442.1 CBS domain-containing protein [Yinghuangia seranimata]
MAHQTVRAVMTADVVSVGPDTEFKDIVRTIQERRVSGVPVVDAQGRVLGVVTEADLLRKEATEGGTADGPRTHIHYTAHRAAQAKARGQRAADLMTAPAVTVRADQTVVEAARLMERRGVRRLPVVDAEGFLDGIVSRADLLRVFLRPDADIRAEIADQVLTRALWINPATVAVTVEDGRVHLSGVLEQKSLIPLVVRLCRAVDGVVGVTHTLRFDYDDSRPRSRRAHASGITDAWMARL